ncbi:MAG: CvpA family protein, partial [Oscillospiraceae bacterium]|nr:CvpA family protein [Oscillospiraceae bacterium]
LLTNQRTKETKYYQAAGATEYAAMASAQGVVQDLEYKATFPLLLNIAEQPTYFIPLKDNTELVKSYAMVNVAQYQIVATGSTVSECEQKYIQLLNTKGLVQEEQLPQTSVTGVIREIRSAVLDGNTLYYLQLEGSENYYSISARESEIAVILNVGDTVTIHHELTDGTDPILIGRAVVLEKRAEPAEQPAPLPEPSAESAPLPENTAEPAA